MVEGVRLRSPAFERNRGPILEVLRRVWGGESPRRILEIASGPGEHACWFASALPQVEWQPTERDAPQVASIDAWRRHLGVGNVLPARRLDVAEEPWAVEAGVWDGALAVNFVHMVDEATLRAALRGLARALRPGGSLVLYECFTFEGGHLSASNAAFDARLRANTPGRVYAWEEVLGWAREVGFGCPELIHLPSNNQGVVLRRGQA